MSIWAIAILAVLFAPAIVAAWRGGGVVLVLLALAASFAAAALALFNPAAAGAVWLFALWCAVFLPWLRTQH